MIPFSIPSWAWRCIGIVAAVVALSALPEVAPAALWHPVSLRHQSRARRECDPRSACEIRPDDERVGTWTQFPSR